MSPSKLQMKLAAGTLALAAFAGVAMFNQAHSEETLKTYQAKVMPMNYLSTYPPSLIYTGDQDAVAFQVLNRTPRAVYFVQGDDKHYIPVVSENTVNFRDIATDGRYSIEDADGNTWFNGEVRLGDKPEYLVNSSTGNYDEWSRELARFTAPDYIPRVEEYQQNDPPRTASGSNWSSPAPARNSSVRGYW
ncbi:MAG: hypothetical protein VKJ04_04155 [Vampirovibrionales bacterium]|nr:hypothetical protein [Vampirovibrionales bacterium]